MGSETNASPRREARCCTASSTNDKNKNRKRIDGRGSVARTAGVFYFEDVDFEAHYGLCV